MRDETRQEISAAYAKDYTDWMVKTGGYARDMTMRDYFAAKAMQSINISRPNTAYDNVARYAYQMADAMLKERNK